MSKQKSVKQRTKNTETYRRENAVKSLYYSRYLLVRYVSAVYLFANLYWCVALFECESFIALVVPSILFLGSLGVMWEQSRMFVATHAFASYTLVYFWFNLGIATLLLISILAGFYGFIFPFFTNSLTTQILLATTQVINVLLSVLVIKRLDLIKHKGDAQYTKIVQYLSSHQK